MRNQVICRYVLPCPVFLPLFPCLPRPLSVLRSMSRPLSLFAYFPPDCHTPENLATVSCGGTCLVPRRKRSFDAASSSAPMTHVFVSSFPPPPRDISPVFHPSRIDITRSVTSTLKPLSSRRSLFPVRTTEPPESGQGGGSSKSDGRVTAL